MINFLNLDVREIFHSRPLDEQKALTEMAESLEKKGYNVTVLFVDPDDKSSEISLRFDAQFYSA